MLSIKYILGETIMFTYKPPVDAGQVEESSEKNITSRRNALKKVLLSVAAPFVVGAVATSLTALSSKEAKAGMGRCNKCGCQYYQGTEQICTYCGHSYYDHW
jgi:hypothetical protein